MHKIVLTGGGTAGHVMPHLAIIPTLIADGWDVVYIGSNGIESSLLADTGVRYHTIFVGKLRRYLSWQNLTDIFRIFLGTLQSLWILLRERPRLVYTKGGFVSVPVAVAAWVLRIPVLTHESDFTPGLANRMIAFFASEIWYSFPETAKFLHGKPAVYTGTPVRSMIAMGQADKGRKLCNFAPEGLPIILIMGGSQGAVTINNFVKVNLEALLQKYRVILITGRGKGIGSKASGLATFEYVSDELPDLLALADCVVSRSGANTLFELLSIQKPMLLIPLTQGSRGDQVDNARSFQQKGWAEVMLESDLTAASFVASLEILIRDKTEYARRMASSEQVNSAQLILDLLKGRAN